MKALAQKYKSLFQLSEKKDRLDQFLEEKIQTVIDVGAFSVKIVQAKLVGEKKVITHAAYRRLPPAENSAPPDIGQGIAGTLQAYKIKPRNVHLVVSDPRIYMRHISIPHVPEEELSKAIRWQAEKYTPFPIEEAVVDYQTLGRRPHYTAEERELIIVAAPREVINGYLAAARSARFQTTFIDLAAFAAAKGVMNTQLTAQDEIVPVLDIGHKATSIVLLKNKDLVMVRNIDFCGEKITRLVMEKLGTDQQTAEEIKANFSLGDESGDPRLKEALRPAVDDLLSQVERSFAYCEREFISDKIYKLYVCGGGSNMKGLDVYFKENLGLPVEKINLFQQFTLDVGVDSKNTIEEHPFVFTPALGGIV